jgi:hypothetical protein
VKPSSNTHQFVLHAVSRLHPAILHCFVECQSFNVASLPFVLREGSDLPTKVDRIIREDDN